LNFWYVLLLILICFIFFRYCLFFIIQRFSHCLCAGKWLCDWIWACDGESKGWELNGRED
jgi:hypothetical protein